MTALLYRWPDVARVEQVVSKNKFYEHAQVSTATRDKFTTEVQRITWAYKLAEHTIKVPGTGAVPEIQVFRVLAKGDDISEAVIAAIDKAVRTPIVFEIMRASDPPLTRMCAAPTQMASPSGKGGNYFSTAWCGEDDRQPLPPAINLSALLTALLEPLLPLAMRPGEDVQDVADRLALVRKLEREINALQRKIRNEPQLNRKVELNRTLKAKQASLAEFISPGMHKRRV